MTRFAHHVGFAHPAVPPCTGELSQGFSLAGAGEPGNARHLAGTMFAVLKPLVVCRRFGVPDPRSPGDVL